MTTTLITACEGIPSETDVVIVSDAALPWLAAAGYVHRDHALRDQLANTVAPEVLNMEEA